MIPSTKCIEKQEKALSLQYDAMASSYKVSFWGEEKGVKLDYGDSFPTG